MGKISSRYTNQVDEDISPENQMLHKKCISQIDIG